MRDIVHLAYMPIVQLHEPKQTLPADAAQHLITMMREIIGYLHSDHIYKGEVLRMLSSSESCWRLRLIALNSIL